MKKILGFGNALTDILLQIEDDVVLQQMNLPKGSMQLVNEEKQRQISVCAQHFNKELVAGGSAANTVNGIKMLGGEAGFIGKLGHDEIGQFYLDDTVESGAASHMLFSDTPSGRCLVLISKDSERTMCTYLGASAELDETDLDACVFREYDYFHIEGYLVQNKKMIRRALEMAKENGLIVSIDMASYNVVEENLDFLLEVVPKYVDIVFANEEEALVLTGAKTPQEALDIIAEKVSIAVVKVGKQGSYIKSEGKTYFIEAGEAKCVDTTGAGDTYAAGFLYGLSLDYPLEICGKIASFVAGNVVEVIGPRLKKEMIGKIRQGVEDIVRNGK